jgi:3-deoxy-manno-octulosonate cytidylyltransferase (CMP-KDO synthetase)
VIVTAAEHPSGTDRLAEVATRLGWADDDVVVNVQGDEPLIPPELIAAAAAALAADPEAAIATACHPLHSADEFFNPNVVKLVLDARGRALYFPRADPLGAGRLRRRPQRAAGGPAGLPPHRPLRLPGGLSQALRQPRAVAAGAVGALEQLRAMAHGYPIQVMVLDHAPPAGVDTADDLERVRRVFDRA